MLSNTGVIVLTMMLSGGSILHQGWNLLGEGEMKGETAVTPKRPSNLTITGKSAVEMSKLHVPLSQALDRIQAIAWESFGTNLSTAGIF